MVRPPYINGSPTVLGASFTRGIGGEVIDDRNSENIKNSRKLSAAAIISTESLVDVESLNMLIIDNHSAYINLDNSTNKTLVSSIIVASVQRNNQSSGRMNISLFFQNLLKPELDVNENYVCSFYNINTSTWNDSSCTKPQYNRQSNRYECSCNHLTSFALIWLPQSSIINGSVVLDAQDKASIAFQIISILCFLGIVIHSVVVRIINPQESTQPRNLLPLISFGITMILFVFYIALGLTVYTRYSQLNPSIQNSPNDSCLPNEHALMYIVYFFIIFMFCSKTSVGYYNYIYFVQLFPPPSVQRLFIAIGLSALIGVIWMAFAAGFDSNPSNAISHIAGGKLCWFTVSVINYFLTIPIVIFLVVNLILFILVAKHIISHAENAQTDPEKYKRRKQCVIVLLSSCVTQGLGWIFGPLIIVANPTAADALAWLFVIFNGLEGFWAILLYLIVRKEKMDRNIRDRRENYLEFEDIEMHKPQNPVDDERHEIRTQKLKSLRSDSPRNSFTDLAGVKPYRRSHLGDNDDR
jgi:hypothetical protein